MSFMSIPAELIRVGDQVNMGEALAKNPNHRWCDVKKVKRPYNHPTIVIAVTARGDKSYLFNEVVDIQRFDEQEA